MDADLFVSKEFSDLKSAGLNIAVEAKTKYYAYVDIDGDTFDATDIIVTLEAVRSDSIYINDERLVKMLKKYGAIRSGGSNRSGISASEGANYDEFLAMMKNSVKKLAEYDKLEWAD